MSPAINAAARKTFLHSTLLRVLASVAFIPCFFIVTRRGGYHFLALIDVVIFVGMWEFYGMLEAKGIRPYRAIGILAGLRFPGTCTFRNANVREPVSDACVFSAIMTLELTRRDGKNGDSPHPSTNHSSV